MNPALAIGFEISGGIIALLAFILTGTAAMLRGARRENAELQNKLFASIENVRAANAAQANAERNYKSYRDEVQQFLQRPIQAQVLLTDEQINTIRNAKSEDFPDITWPTNKKVN